MEVFSQLDAEGVTYVVDLCMANCDICHKIGEATLTARITPVGSTWVGGKEAYRSCCPPCFQEHNVYLNPLSLLDNPGFYTRHKR
jgi:hypothetical protein